MVSAAPEKRTDTAIPVGIELRHAHAGWAGGVLFDDLAVSLRGGDWTCLLGPSGVGKSMLLRMILGLSQNGVVSSGDVVCSDDQDLVGRVSYMAQQDLLYPWLTVLENVCLGARLRGARESGRPAECLDMGRRYLEDVGLAGYERALPRTLSGGMRQRAALARTLVENRPVVLMDEPFSALDAITRVRLQDMAVVALRGRTVLLVTHDPLEALRLGHNIHVMSGRPAVLDDPLQITTARPRRVDDVNILALQGELLRRLSEAAG